MRTTISQRQVNGSANADAKKLVARIAGSKPLSQRPQARVLRDLRQWIEEGVFDGGQPLPSEHDLAHRFGVSRGTVRRALAVLSEEGVLGTRKGKMRIVTTPGARAGGLLSDTVAVLTPFDEPGEGRRQSGWLEYITQGALQEVRAAGRHALSLHPERLKAADIERLARGAPHGVVITDLNDTSSRMRDLASALSRRGVPVVVCGGAPELAAYDRVISDHEDGAYQLTRWLLEQGRQRIVTVWHAPIPARYWFAQRRAGYERALREAGLTPGPGVALPPFPPTSAGGDEFESRSRFTAGYLAEYLTGPEPAQAFLASTDRDVFSIARACRLLGKTPGRDVLIAGYDNYWAECRECAQEPVVPAATVDKRNRVLGAEMVRLLLDRIQGRLPGEPQCRVVQPKLIVADAGAADGA